MEYRHLNFLVVSDLFRNVHISDSSRRKKPSRSAVVFKRFVQRRNPNSLVYKQLMMIIFIDWWIPSTTIEFCQVGFYPLTFRETGRNNLGNSGRQKLTLKNYEVAIHIVYSSIDPA